MAWCELIGEILDETTGLYMTQESALAALRGLRDTPTMIFRQLADEYRR